MWNCFQMAQAAPQNKEALGYKRECCKNTNLLFYNYLLLGGDYKARYETRTLGLWNTTNNRNLAYRQDVSERPLRQIKYQQCHRKPAKRLPMFFMGNLLVGYHDSFIHSSSPFFTRPVLKIFEIDFTHHPLIGRPFSPFVWLSYSLERTHFSPFWPFLFVPGERTLCYLYFICSWCRIHV